MDLDKIKNTWQKTEIKPQLSEESIEKILSQKGRSAFRSIRSHKTFNMIGTFVFIFLGILLCRNAIVYDELNKIFPFFITASAILGFIGNLYERSILKKVDFSTMSIISIAKAANTYQVYAQRKKKIMIVWTVLVVITIVYPHSVRWDSTTLVVIGIIGFIFIAGSSHWIYMRTIQKHLNILQKEIDEAEEGSRIEK